MTYSFRIHGAMGDGARIDCDAPSLSIWTDEDAQRHVAIRSAAGGPISETGDLILVGTGWESQAEATKGGESWASAILFGFSHHAIAMSLGRREKTWGGINPEAAPAVREMLGLDDIVRVVDDAPGVLAFRTDPSLRFVRMKAKAHKRPRTDRLLESVLDAYETGADASTQQHLAFELYNHALNIDAPDIRFVTLMMAIECLIEFAPRSGVVREIIDRAIEETKKLPDDAARASFVGSLRHLLNESISSAGQRLAATLDERIAYMGESPVQFFRICYAIRSALVHGSGKAPTAEEVDIRAASLEIMVGDLLSVPLLGFQTGREPGAAPP